MEKYTKPYNLYSPNPNPNFFNNHEMNNTIPPDNENFLVF